MDAQLKRGILNICILYLLRESMYGYDLIKKIQGYFPDTDESTLYAILRRLNREGLTDMHYGNISHGPERKYYVITDKGKEQLGAYTEAWKHIENVFDEIGI